MKYSSSNKPLQCMMTQSTCYKGTRKMKVKGILWHSTGANNPTLKRYVQPDDNASNRDELIKIIGKNQYGNDMNHIYRKMGMNAWIGKLADGTVAAVQVMPWDYRPWGCASGRKGTCNDHWIQFETCEDGLQDEAYFKQVYKEGCELTAYLCKMFDIDPHGTVDYNGQKIPTIICHQDSYRYGCGNNHSDIYNWYPRFGKNMNTIRDDVAYIMGQDPEPKPEAGKYEVYTSINKYRSADDASAQKNSAGTLKPGTYNIYTGWPNGYKGMYNLTTDPTGAAPGSWINPKENTKPTPPPTDQLYRVRKSKDDAKSQLGAFKDLNNAIACCKSAGVGYYVFDKDFNIVYPTTPPKDQMYRVRKSKDDAKSQIGAFKDLNNAIACCNQGGVGYHVFDKDFNIVYSAQAAPETPKPVEPTPEVKPEEPKPAPEVKPTPEPKPEVKPEVITPVYDLTYPDPVKIVDHTQNYDKEAKVNCVKAIKFITRNNPNFDVEIAKAFFAKAPLFDINPIVAISQSILETGWFKYQGSAVTADQHNYCGLGVTSTGKKGGQFDTIEQGVLAQLQHLYAYGCADELPTADLVYDPRFQYVSRGISPYWQNLAGRWAVPGYNKSVYSTPQKAMEAGDTYGQKIVKIAKQLDLTVVSDEEIEKYFPIDVKPVEPEIPDEVLDGKEGVFKAISIAFRMLLDWIEKLFKSK